MPSATPRELPGPWRAFLVDVDRQLPRPIELHCLGGFVAAAYSHLPRPTNDLDYIEVVPHDAMATVQAIAGIESPLARKHRVHVQHVAVASLPESYAERLIEIVPGKFQRLRLLALDPHDLALSKLARNSPIDRDDVARLAKAVPLDAELLRARYRDELRPIVIGDPTQHDRTLEMWIEAYFGS
jgi:uncharacterized nucleotidyltransferase DUF6036